MSLKDVKLSYKRKVKNASLIEILNVLIKYCEDCMSKKNKNDVFDQLFYDFLKIDELKRFFVEQKRAWEKEKKSSTFLIGTRSLRSAKIKVADCLLRDTTSKNSSQHPVVINIVQRPIRIGLFGEEIEKITKGQKSLSTEWMHKDKQYQGKVGEISKLSGRSKDDALIEKIFACPNEFVEASKDFANKFNLNCSLGIQEIVKDLNFICRDVETLKSWDNLNKILKKAKKMSVAHIKLMDSVIADIKRTRKEQKLNIKTIQKKIQPKKASENDLPVDYWNSVFEAQKLSLETVKKSIVMVHARPARKGSALEANQKNLREKQEQQHQKIMDKYEKKLADAMLECTEMVKELDNYRND